MNGRVLKLFSIASKGNGQLVVKEMSYPLGPINILCLKMVVGLIVRRWVYSKYSLYSLSEIITGSPG